MARYYAMILSLLLFGCSTEYHETAQNKVTRLRNEETMRQYWATHRMPP